MNDSILTPIGQSEPKTTRLSDEFAARMRAIQERVKDWPPAEIGRIPAETGHDALGEVVVAKFVAHAYHPASALPMYAIVDEVPAEKMRSDGDLHAQWRQIVVKGGNKYVLIDRKQTGRFVSLKDLYRIATGMSVADDQSVIFKNGNLADLRACNLATVPFKRGKKLQVPALHWQKTPLDSSTHAHMLAKQKELEGVSRLAIRWVPFIEGNLLDGKPIALKLVTSPYPHPETGFWRYEITDRIVADWFNERQNPLDPWGWSLSFGKNGDKPPSLLISRKDGPQLARVVYGLLHPDEPLSKRLAIATDDKNPLDMREGNLIPKPKGHKPKCK
jgi:hypothetical protein